MNPSRRDLLRGGTALGLAGLIPRPILAADWPKPRAGDTRVVLLHTNDTHSRLDAFPLDGGRYEGLAGVARRKTLIDRVRAAEKNVLLVDSGDVFQGTPYFNFFNGVADYQAMSRLGYDVVTLGNHDFDGGSATLSSAMEHASFQFVSANLDVVPEALSKPVHPYVVKDFATEGSDTKIRVGFFGLCVAFEGLVASHLHKGVTWHEPIARATKIAETLRRDEACDAVVCLSHLGYSDGSFSPGDTTLAARVPGLDLILGGHTHSFIKEPEATQRPDGGTCWVTQAGFAGIWLGRVSLDFDGKSLARVSGGYLV
jgi:5'-nucleotidase